VKLHEVKCRYSKPEPPGTPQHFTTITWTTKGSTPVHHVRSLHSVVTDKPNQLHVLVSPTVELHASLPEPGTFCSIVEAKGRKIKCTVLAKAYQASKSWSCKRSLLLGSIRPAEGFVGIDFGTDQDTVFQTQRHPYCKSTTSPSPMCASCLYHIRKKEDLRQFCSRGITTPLWSTCRSYELHKAIHSSDEAEERRLAHLLVRFVGKDGWIPKPLATSTNEHL